MGERAPLAEWRNAIRDSDLNTTTKCVAFVLGCYFTADGRTGHDIAHPSPAKTTLARGAGLSVKYKGSRAVDASIDRLEAAGFLEVERRRGARGFGYRALIPHTGAGLIPHDHAGLEPVESRTERQSNPARNGSRIPHVGAGECVESDSKAVRARASAPEALALIDEPCLGAGCTSQQSRYDGSDGSVLCDECRANLVAA